MNVVVVDVDVLLLLLVIFNFQTVFKSFTPYTVALFAQAVDPFDVLLG